MDGLYILAEAVFLQACADYRAARTRKAKKYILYEIENCDWLQLVTGLDGITLTHIIRKRARNKKDRFRKMYIRRKENE